MDFVIKFKRLQEVEEVASIKSEQLTRFVNDSTRNCWLYVEAFWWENDVVEPNGTLFRLCFGFRHVLDKVNKAQWASSTDTYFSFPFIQYFPLSIREG